MNDTQVAFNMHDAIDTARVKLIHDLDDLLKQALEAYGAKDEESEFLNNLFDMRHEADMRAVARWRAEDPEGRKLWMPDHEDLCIWLMSEVDRLTATQGG